MDLMGLKSKILDEILDDLSERDGSDKLKPKAAVSITAIKPGEEDGHEDPLAEMGHSAMADDDDDDEEMLKQLLQERLSQK